MAAAMGLWTAVAHLGQEMEGITLQQRQTGPRAGCLVSPLLGDVPCLDVAQSCFLERKQTFQCYAHLLRVLLYFHDGKSPTARVKTEGEGLIYTHFFLSLHFFVFFCFVFKKL